MAKKGKIAGWASTLQEYDLRVIHRPGSKMTHVDALSRAFYDEDMLQDRMVLRMERQEIPSLEIIKRELVGGIPLICRHAWYLTTGQIK